MELLYATIPVMVLAVAIATLPLLAMVRHDARAGRGELAFGADRAEATEVVDDDEADEEVSAAA